MSTFEETVNTPSQNITTTQSGKVFIDDAKDRMIAYDGANNLALFGKDDAGEVVVKVAKPGFDANNAAPENLIFNSSQNVFKIVEKIPVAFNISSGSGGATSTFSYNHNLGYEPLIFAAASMTGSGGLSGVTGLFVLPYLLPAISSATGVGPWGTIAASLSVNRVTTSQVFFNYFLMPSSGLSGIITMYVLQESAN